MKKILILFFATVSLISCGPSKEEVDAMEKERQKEKSNDMNFKVERQRTVTLEYYNLDDCQYIGTLTNSSGDFIAHSGHCPYCAKRLEKLLDSLVKKNLYEFFVLSKDSTKAK